MKINKKIIAIALSTVMAAGSVAQIGPCFAAEELNQTQQIEQNQTTSVKSPANKENWEKFKELTAKGWDETKELTAKGWDKTKELTAKGWDETKKFAHNHPKIVKTTAVLVGARGIAKLRKALANRRTAKMKVGVGVGAGAGVLGGNGLNTQNAPQQGVNTQNTQQTAVPTQKNQQKAVTTQNTQQKAVNTPLANLIANELKKQSKIELDDKAYDGLKKGILQVIKNDSFKFSAMDGKVKFLFRSLGINQAGTFDTLMNYLRNIFDGTSLPRNQANVEAALNAILVKR